MRRRGEQEPSQEVLSMTVQGERPRGRPRLRYGYHHQGYESEWNGGEGCSGSGEVAKSDSTGYPFKKDMPYIWHTKISKSAPMTAMTTRPSAKAGGCVWRGRRPIPRKGLDGFLTIPQHMG